MIRRLHICLPGDVYALVAARAAARKESVSSTVTHLVLGKLLPKFTVTADGESLGTYDRREDAERAALNAAEKFARFVIVQPKE